MAASDDEAYIKSVPATNYMINHVFLPSQLPQQDDYRDEYENYLLQVVLTTLSVFTRYAPECDEGAVNSIADSLQLLQSSMCNEKQLIQVFDDVLIKKHGTVVFHVKAQNAGVMFTRSDESIHVEVFELSSNNRSVMSTKGRLRRVFPGSASSLPLDTFKLDEFQASIAQTLVAMSIQKARDAKPKVKKTGKMHDEDRDTTHPKMVTDFLSALLSYVGSPVQVDSILKHTREEVFWKDCQMPWHRSAQWMLIRVALQLQFSRLAASHKCPKQAYKIFMLYFMAHILLDAHTVNPSSDVLSAMNSKLSRRLQKIAGSVPTRIFNLVESSLSVTDRILREMWSRIEVHNCVSHNMEPFRHLDFEGDTHIRPTDLDDYIRSLDRQENGNGGASLRISSPLDIYGSSKIPLFTRPLDAQDMAYKLAGIETWVADNLSRWTQENQQNPMTCGSLKTLIVDYYSAALNLYKGNPEMISIAILTILELWVASDKSAVENCPLLGKYDSGVPLKLLENLNLPLRRQMERLQAIERYLLARKSQATYECYDVLRSYGKHHSFSVMYFDQSIKHQELLTKIKEDARNAREAKRREFRAKRDEFEDTLQRSKTASHEYNLTFNPRIDDYIETHAGSCHKCQLEKEAYKMSINIHEEPLPTKELQAKSTVFELWVPPFFGYWRDTTMFILFDVLQSQYLVEKKPGTNSRTKLDNPLTKGYYRPFDSNQRIILMSGSKSHTRTHRSLRDVSLQREDELFLQNGLSYKYFDAKIDCFVNQVHATAAATESCTYSMPNEMTSIQQFINRPASDPHGPSPNTVLASQSSCPDDLSLEEYKALTSLPLGVDIQWQNILVQLALPSIDFKKEVTTLVILQCIFQAGPRDGDSALRKGHKILADKSFALSLLRYLEKALERVRENWQSYQAPGIFIAIARRLLSLTPMEDIQLQCLKFLSSVRRVALNWVQVIDDKIQSITDDAIRKELRHKATRIALICVETFNIDDQYLRRVLASPQDACIMIRCTIAIQEGLSQARQKTQGLEFIALQRWYQLSYRSFGILADQITNHKNPALDNAVKESWSGFRPIRPWRVLLGPFHHWLETRSSCEEGDGALPVHFSLLTGELLIDGCPLGRLPKEYEQHSMYSALFGKSIIEVRPSSVPGMRFSSKKPFNGHRIDFGINSHKKKKYLRIRAVTENRTFEAIPPCALEGQFPKMFVDNFVHWYNRSEGHLEFCPCELPWDHSEKNWRLLRCGDTWRLTKGNSFLVNISSDTAKKVYEVLNHLESSPWTHVILDKSSLEIELPRLKLGFYIKEGETSIYSRQFRGMVIDEDQSIGTLIGLSTKLVLRGQNGGLRRRVIIPSGNITLSGTLEHVKVHIQHSPTTRVHSYEVDNLLGRLINNSSLQSRLLIAYLHALTSFPLPDPLTKRTGTENALAILESAAVRSFKYLTEEDIGLLQQIAALTPERYYYPENMQEMQTVSWSPVLGFLAQDGEFFQIVYSIYEQAAESGFLYPESQITLPSLPNINEILLRRDLIRSSSFRTIGFGAEKHTEKHDANYSARDRGGYTPQASHAVAVSSMLFDDNFRLRYNIERNPRLYTWEFLKHHASGLTHGPSFSVAASKFKYDSRLLVDPYPLIAEQWIPLHKLFSSPTDKPNKFQMMFWLATIAYAPDADLGILQILASFYAEPRMRSITIPNAKTFTPAHGHTIEISQLERIIKDCCQAFQQCPEADLPQLQGENRKTAQNRRMLAYQTKRNEAASALALVLKVQFPCEVPDYPNAAVRMNIEPYIKIETAMEEASKWFKSCFYNHQLTLYSGMIYQNLPRETITVQVHKGLSSILALNPTTQFKLIENKDVLSSSAPVPLPDLAMDVLSPTYNESDRTPRLPSLLSRLKEQAESGYEKGYVEDLGSSVTSLQNWRKEYTLPLAADEIKYLLTFHQRACRGVVKKIYTTMRNKVEESLRDRNASTWHWPRISPIFFLERLSHRYWGKLPGDWKELIVHYGVAISQLQRAQRLLRVMNNPAALIKELQNPGHTNWKPIDQPDSLLLEIDSDIMIREVQEQIAVHMRNPESGRNSVMQLNMGEGKSSVIVPAVAAALADGDRLVRVIVGKPQSKQMFQMLVYKLGGLLDRRIYHMPFSRAVKIDDPQLQALMDMFNSCINDGGVFLVQPEHLLSFKLMGIECLLTGKESLGRSLTELQSHLNSWTRDIVDESDENFSVKFELVYTMGTQRPTEFSPDRWVCIQQVLDKIRGVIAKAYSDRSDSIELRFQAFGCFPWTRITKPDVATRILLQITEQICATGLSGFPITRQPEHIREAVRRYITEMEPTADDIALVEDPSPNGFWIGAKDTLLLLRGLIAGGVLAFAFGHKRWRVDYGLDVNRSPGTRLAVPYKAKDSPSPRSEFSHPDVVILLTSLSYYYGGLSDKDLFMTFAHLLKSDHAELEYGLWARAANDLDASFRQLVGVNLEDSQCTEHVFKNLRYVKGVIDYFLAHIVFLKEMKEFPHKLSASGWDLGEVKTHPTTGFSGTNDSRKVLPLNVEQLDLPAQKHTNALVLEYLLQPENSVQLMPSCRDLDVSIAEMLLDTITRMEPPTRVILDVGAQILELNNLEVAATWLRRNSHDGQIQAAVYFDDHDEIYVLDRKGNSEPLQTSPYATQLDACLVFLDEAHTRGTDLKLPKDYRAAVTLGANLTKDRLVQACMRMRMLGEGQSVVFCVPEEIQTKIQARKLTFGLFVDDEISVLDILTWAISETWQDIHRSMGLWANQGRRHEKHLKAWEEARAAGLADEQEILFEKSLAERYLEEESQTIKRRYRPRTKNANALGGSSENDSLDPISKRCKEFTNLNIDSATLQEEEERELSPEIEQEREDQRPPAADPAAHTVHPDVELFVSTGIVYVGAKGYGSAFKALKDTTAGALFKVGDFHSGVLASVDFERTIRRYREDTIDVLDSYQRNVQWVLTSGYSGSPVVSSMMVISPYEAYQLLPKIEKSESVALHLYAPRSSLGYERLDTLDLYTVPERLSTRQIPQRFITQLNLFAGQLYFNSYEQYVDACKFLGISYDTPGEGEEIAADGFILRDAFGRVGSLSGLQCSPVKFFKVLHTKIRRNCESISKTHMGKLLDNQLLKPEDFENDG